MFNRGNLKKARLSQLEIRDKIKIDKQMRLSWLKKLSWPKMIVSDTEVCVPKIQFAKNKDWASHLICNKYSSEATTNKLTLNLIKDAD